MKSSPNSSKNATIKDVAKMAGVSIYTVSRVVNNQGGVSEESEKSVRKAIAKLQYRPNRIARALKGKATQSIGLIIPSIENPVFPPLVKVIETTAAQQGFSIVLCISDGDVEKEAQYLELLIDKQVDGILFNALGTYHAGFKTIKDYQIPLVVIGKKIPGFPSPNVSVSNYRGAFLAVEHLIGTGLRRIAFLFGQLESSSAIQDRFAGYKEALQEHGIPFREELVVKGDWSFDGGIEATEELMSRKVPFDAVFGSNDTIAIGCIERLLEKGYKIPQDVSVIGYDDVPFARIIRPHLSTVRAPNEKFGAEAVGALLRLIHSGAPEVNEISFEPELILRDSTKSL